MGVALSILRNKRTFYPSRVIFSPLVSIHLGVLSSAAAQFSEIERDANGYSFIPNLPIRVRTHFLPTHLMHVGQSVGRGQAAENVGAQLTSITR